MLKVLRSGITFSCKGTATVRSYLASTFLGKLVLIYLDYIGYLPFESTHPGSNI